MKRQILLSMLVLVAMLLAACAAPTPQVIEKEVIVEKEVPVTVEVVKEKVVEKLVVQTVVVEKVVEKAEAEPVKGGWLTILYRSTIQDTGDLHIANSSNSAFLAGHALDTLIRKNPADGMFYPGLATLWEISPDNLSVTLKLRKDVRFHDGTPFNAQAVKFNLDRIATLPEAKGRFAYRWLSVGNLYDKTEVIDDYTVKIYWKEPYAPMLYALSTNQVGGINSPTAIQKYGDKYGTEAIVGTGPFKFVEWTGPLGEATFERNEEYNWASPIYKHQGPPYPDGFTFKGVVEPSTRRSAMEAGDVDGTLLVESDVAYFRDRPGFKLMFVHKQGTTRIMMFNLRNPILQDIRVRQAIAHAIDREEMLNSPHWGGVADPGMTFTSPALWAQSTEEFKPFNYLYDFDKAKALLEEVGWRDEDGDGIREAHGVKGVPDGTNLQLLEVVNANVREESELLQGMLAKMGIKIEMQVVDFATMMGLAREGKYDMNIQSTSGSTFYLIEQYFHSREIEGGSNFTTYSNPEVDKLFNEADQTLDPAKQRELFAQIQKIILQDIPAFPMWGQIDPFVLKEGVEDLTVDLAGKLYLYDTWINPNP